tara:strand:- start:8240 stop:8464 length:225 start_codon:yes stop_codon:yes gene_type:complete
MDIIKNTRCAKCGIKPDDMSDLTMGEWSPHPRSRWYCFDHVDIMFKLCGPNIITTSDYWSYLESKNKGSPRPRG